MTAKAEYSMGWMNSSVHDFLAEIDEPPDSMSFALVTSLDSSSSLDLPPLLNRSPLLRELAEHVRVIGGGLLLQTRRLLVAERTKRIFFGFDEVWFLPHDRVTPLPDNVQLVGPERLTKQSLARMGGLLEWLERTGCQIGLGDGMGLNFVARLAGIPKYIIEEYAAVSLAAEPMATS